jgi:hypothetical protein
VDKIHGPDIIRADCLGAILAQLRLHPPFRRLVPELHAQLPVNAIDFLDVDTPPLTVQQDVDASAAIPDTRLTDLPDPLCHGSLIGAAGLVVKRRAVESDGPTSRPDRHRPIAAHPANQFAHATRLQIFRRMTS